MMTQRFLANVVALSLVGLLLIAVPAHAELSGLKQGIDAAQEAAKGAGLLNDDKTTAKSIILDVINVVLSIVGLLAVLFLIIAGVMYITSLGDEGKAEKAKKMILYIIIGILLVLFAAVIVNFVLSRGTGAPVDLPPG